MIEFSVPAVSCGHCVRAVTEAVHRVDPQAHVDVDLPAHRVRIDATALPRERFAEALADEGYPPAA